MANANYSVSQIGMYNLAGNTQPHAVAVWDVNTNMLASVVIVPNGTAGWFYTNVTPFVVTNGELVYAGSQWFAAPPDYWPDDNSTFTCNGWTVQGSYNTGVSGLGLAIPNNIAQSGQHFYNGIDFVFTNLADIVHHDTFYATNGSWAELNWFMTNGTFLKGDTLIDPPSTNTFSHTLQRVPGTWLIGSGTNSTVIIDETPAVTPQQNLISMFTVPGVLDRVSGIQFKYGVTNQPFNSLVVATTTPPLHARDTNGTAGARIAVRSETCVMI